MASKKEVVSVETVPASTVVEVGSFEPVEGQGGSSVPPRDLLEAPLAEDFGSRMPFAEDISGVKYGFQEAREGTEPSE
jgi:hypothetical protein